MQYLAARIIDLLASLAVVVLRRTLEDYGPVCPAIRNGVCPLDTDEEVAQHGND